MAGLSGILRPNGIFVQCSYKNHGEAASKIPAEESDDCIYISSGEETKHSDAASIIYFNDTLTPAQAKWFLKNYTKLDKRQQELVKNYALKKDTSI